MKVPNICGLALGAGLAAMSASAAERVTVSTLEWPPYSGTALPKQGATTEVVRQAFAAAGVDTEVMIVPWKRAIALAGADETVAAYFPGYHCRHAEGFVPSEPIGNGPLGFAENAEAPIAWTSLDDLGAQKMRIGTVLGYANTDEFDRKAAAGEIGAIPASDDATNLRKLALRRLDAAVIDKLVLSYLLATDPTLSEAAGRLRFHERPLEEKTLYLCFTDTPEGHALRDRFNAGLATLDVEGIVDAYFRDEF